MTLYKMLLAVHVAAGIVALLTYWAAAIARKGSLVHRRVGQTFLVAMLGIVLTAVPIAIVFVAQGRVAFGAFFGYLVVITFTAMWSGWRAIRSKRDVRGYLTPFYRVLAWFNIASGLVVFAIGLKLSSVLLMGFCWIGIVAGIGMLRQLGAPPTARNWWLKEHYSAMIGSGIATHVAFLGLGLARMLQPFDIVPPQELAWFAPIAIAIAARIYLDRKYGPRQQVRPVDASGPSLQPSALPGNWIPIRDATGSGILVAQENGVQEIEPLSRRR